MKSNKEYYEDLEKSGSLDSAQKDGKPKTKAQKAVALHYPIVVIIITAITTMLLFLKKKQMNFKVLGPLTIIGALSGWSWGIYMEKFDPVFPGWLFHPWAVVGPEWILTLEDWVFYPVCGVFFYVIYSLIKNTHKSKAWTKWCFQYFHIALTLFFAYFGSVCGRTVAFHFAGVSIFLFFYVWDRWDTLHYLKILLFIMAFATLWDWAAVSWIAKIPGMSWASGWMYLTFDSSGVAHHSAVFLSYEKCKWAWIFDNPIEITPWFGIAGGMFIYSVAMGIEKFIDSTSHSET